jgi:hypothetical protein
MSNQAQDLENILIAQYNNWTSVLNRIKKDERKWITNLLIIYGAILGFIVTNYGNAFNFYTQFGNLFALILTFVGVILISFIWTHQSLNLRLQYYKSMFEIEKIALQQNMEIDEIWINGNFTKWRNDVTRPLESKIVDYWLLGGLNLIVCSLSVYRFLPEDVFYCPCIWLFLLIVFSLLTIILSLFFPLFYFDFSDKKRLEKLFDENIGTMKKLDGIRKKNIETTK